MTTDQDRADAEVIAADHRLLEDLRAGAEPPTGDQIARCLAAWRDDHRQGT